MVTKKAYSELLSTVGVFRTNGPHFSEVAKVYKVTRLSPLGMVNTKKGLIGMAALGNAAYLSSGYSFINPDSSLQCTTAFGIAVVPIFLWCIAGTFPK